jgi:hypothetical protein
MPDATPIQKSPKTGIFPLMGSLIITLCLTLSGSARALEWDVSGQLSGWTVETHSQQESWDNDSGLRYIPQLSVKQRLNKDYFFDAEISFNAFLATDKNDDGNTYDVEIYRAKFRFATPQTETRIGLQKITFGPAQLLRPLRWFDRLDPTDPLGLTDGVYALRFRYDALNNAGFWFWILYGNKDPKGYEVLPTVSRKPEFGGRLQYPILGGELAGTCHFRKVDGSEVFISDYWETRFALDGQWDVGIGLWFEAAFEHFTFEPLLLLPVPVVFPYEWNKMISLGMDYTFDLGNGLYMRVEHMAAVISEDLFGWDEDEHVSAFSLSYPVGTIDTLTAIGYYLWEQKEYGQYIRWQRTYDHLELSLGLFYYPEASETGAFLSRSTAWQGYGAQFMIIFNH